MYVYWRLSGMNPKILLLIALFSSVALTGCLEKNNPNTLDESSMSAKSSQEVRVQSDLGECNPGKSGSVVFLRSDNSFFTCENNVWVAIDLKGEKGEKGDAGENGVSAPTVQSPCDSLVVETLRYGDRIDGSDYSFNAIRTFPEKKYCLSNGEFMWVDYLPSIKLMTSVPAAQIAFEESICKAAFSFPIVENYFHTTGIGPYLLEVRNGNMSGKLKRAIICDPDAYGVSLVFPNSY